MQYHSTCSYIIPPTWTFNFISPSASKSNKAIFWRYHKIKVGSLSSYLANFSFVRYPGNIADAFYE